MLFYSAKSISDHCRISELKIFFSKDQFFSLFRTQFCKGEKHEVRKQSFLVLFYSAKSNSDNVTNSNFSNFFRKINFFTVSNPTLHKREKWSQQKLSSVFSLTVQKPFETILGIQFFFKTYKILNFSQYASHGKCVEYAKLNTTQNQRKICKIYAKFNAEHVRSTLYKNCVS